MHMYLFAVFPVTGLLVAGYVTLYCAKASQGRMQTLGKILSGWAFLLAIVVAVAAVACPAFGLRPHGMMGDHPMHGMMMNGGMMDREGLRGPPPGMPNAPDASPAPPASPPPQ